MIPFSFYLHCRTRAKVSSSELSSSELTFSLATDRLEFISSQSLNRGGSRDTTDDVATIHSHPSLSSAALRESPNPISGHSLMLSSYLFFFFPLLLAHFTVPCRTVFAMPEDLEMWPYHLNFRFFIMDRRSSYSPIAFWILLWTSSCVTWSS